MDNLKRLFGTQLRAGRKERGWTQAKLAESANLSVDMIGRLERGEAAPSIDTVETMSRVLAIPAAVLFGGSSFTDGPLNEREEALQRTFAMIGRLSDGEVLWLERVIAEVLRR